MMTYSPITPQIRERIVQAVGAECIVSAESCAVLYDRDESELRADPELVVRPTSAEEISEILKLANEYRFPVIPRGGGTGLTGGCLAVGGGVVLTLEAMDRILAIDPVDLTAEIQPGVITQTFRDAVKGKGLFYPPDPAGMDRSTIGGNAATSAGGPACVKYGTTKDYVLGLEAVLPMGEIIRTGSRTRKGVVGYDLTHLLVGSEGTLGVITALTLKLIPLPPAVAGVGVIFPDLESAMRAVTGVMTRGHLPSAIEFMDHKCLRLVGDMLPFDIPSDRSTLLIVETDGAREQVGRDIEAMGRICSEFGATRLLPAPTDSEREKIWEVRRQVSLRIHDYAAVYVSEDVAVPLGRIADLIAALPDFESRYGLEIFAFGHAGDGNIHLNVTAAAKDDPERIEAGIRETLAYVLRMGGTISGEHGIGAAKRDFLAMELSPPSIALQQGIKKVFDPNTILNPHKIFPEVTG